MNIFLKNKFIIYFLIYLTFIISFIFEEDSSGGSRKDFLAMQIYYEQISININEGINFFIDKGQGHSPVFYIIKSFFEKILNKTISDLLFLSLSFLIPLVFYLILKKKFTGVNKNLLFGISIILYLSPYLRSSASWATNDNLAILFFLFSISKFFSFKKNLNNSKNIFLCFFYIIIATYIRQYYIMIILAYFFLLYKNINIKLFFNLVIFISTLLIPGFLYTYNYLLINSDYATKGFVKPDIIFNFLIFFNMYLFYILPFFFSFENYKKIKIFYRKKKLFLFVISIIFTYIFFNYDLPTNQFGGGIHYKIYQLLDLKIFFIFSAFIGLLLLLSTINLNLRNFFMILIFFLMFPFSIIYQKYYDPILIIFFFAFFQSDLIYQKIKSSKINLTLIFTYFLLFLIGSNIYYLNI